MTFSNATPGREGRGQTEQDAATRDEAERGGTDQPGTPPAEPEPVRFRWDPERRQAVPIV